MSKVRIISAIDFVRRDDVKALAAEVITTLSDVGKVHPEYYQDSALGVIS